MPPNVEFRKVGYAINGRPLVENISFVIESGETVVFLGRSGSGKTTTLKLINRLLEPTSGEVFVEGKKTTEWDAIRLRRRIGYVIQDVGLFPHFTVHRNVGLVPSLESWPPDKIDSRVHDMLSLVGLEPSRFAGRLPRELSGGQRQRVGVARALAADPSILLLDEPFGALDPVTRSEIQKEFRGLQKSLGKTMVFVTHDVREAFILGDRIGLMKDGNLIALVAVKDFHNLNHPDARAPCIGRAVDTHCSRNWPSSRRSYDTQARAQRSDSDIRERRPSDPKPGFVWLFDSVAIHWRYWSAYSDCCIGSVLAIAYHPQYVYRNFGSRSGHT